MWGTVPSNVDVSHEPVLPYNACVGAPDRLEREPRDQRFAMRLSLVFGVAMMVGKSDSTGSRSAIR